MSTKLSPLKGYPERSYAKAKGTTAGKFLVAATMAASSLGGCGPPVDRQIVDATIDRGDLDATIQDAPKDTPADQVPAQDAGKD